MTDDLDATLNRMLQTAATRSAKLREFMAKSPQSITCKLHPEISRKIDEQVTFDLSFGQDLTAGYAPCPKCEERRTALEFAQKLYSSGVPKNLLHCRLDNWTAINDSDNVILKRATEFASKKTGFLVMFGNVGTGKTHIAVGVAREFAMRRRSVIFITQSELLNQMRLSYHDGINPVVPCQNCGLLVIDEVGVSGGGKDELPMLHDILNFRYGDGLPTILISNCALEQFKQTVGERMADRLREAVALSFAGDSRRADATFQHEDFREYDLRREPRFSRPYNAI